jgi:hypothetical protein
MFVESHPTGNRSRFISGCDIDSILAFIDSKIEYFLLKQHYLRELKKEESKHLLLEKKKREINRHGKCIGRIKSIFTCDIGGNRYKRESEKRD